MNPRVTLASDKCGRTFSAANYYACLATAPTQAAIQLSIFMFEAMRGVTVLCNYNATFLHGRRRYVHHRPHCARLIFSKILTASVCDRFSDIAAFHVEKAECNVWDAAPKETYFCDQLFQKLVSA